MCAVRVCLRFVFREGVSMKVTKLSILGLAVSLYLPGVLFADYTIVLENGRRVTVQNYWEESGMVKFRGLGGEIGIARKQIQSIAQATETEPHGVVISMIENSPIVITPTVNLLASEKDVAQTVPSPNVRQFEVEDQLAREYQGTYRDLKQQIQSRRELRWLITRGTTSPDPTLINSLRVLNARIDDLNSRIKDSEHNPARSRGTGIVNLEVGSPFGGGRMTIGLRHGGKIVPGRVIARHGDMARPGKRNLPEKVLHHKQKVRVPLPGYSYREKELSELRNQLIDLYDQRKQLIQDMKDRGIFTGSIPFEESP
jgi:hypothetical protein